MNRKYFYPRMNNYIFILLFISRTIRRNLSIIVLKNIFVFNRSIPRSLLSSKSEANAAVKTFIIFSARWYPFHLSKRFNSHGYWCIRNWPRLFAGDTSIQRYAWRCNPANNEINRTSIFFLYARKTRVTWSMNSVQMIL